MNTKNKQNLEKNMKVPGECKPLPLTYLFACYVDSEGNPAGGYEPVVNTVFFSKEKVPVLKSNGFYGKEKETLSSWSTNENGVIKQLGRDFSLGCDIRNLKEVKLQKFFMPPLDTMSYIFAAHGENWADKVATLLEGAEPEELEREDISFEQIRLPKPANEVPKVAEEAENRYRIWYNSQKKYGNKALHGFKVHKTRAVILTFSDIIFFGRTVHIWPHGAEYNSFFMQNVARDEGSGLLVAIFRGSEEDLPRGLYNIRVSGLDVNGVNDKRWGNLVKKTDNSSFTLKEKFRFDVNNLAGDFEIINCDPITIEEAMLQQFPLQYTHLIEHAIQLTSGDKSPKADAKNTVPQGFQGVVHNITLAKSKAKLIAGVLGADDRSKKFWAYGQALSLAIPDGTDLKKTVDLMFQAKDFKGKLVKLQQARVDAAKAKALFTETLDMEKDFKVNKASGLPDDDHKPKKGKSQSLASKYKIPERYLTKFDKYMGVVGKGLSVNALGVAVTSYVQVSKQAKENIKHMDEVATDYHRQVHEMAVPMEGEKAGDIRSFLYYDKFGKLTSEQKGTPEKDKRLVLNVTFDVDKSIVKLEFTNCIDAVVTFMETYPKSVTLIEGHTDSTHSYLYNLQLSMDRGKAIQALLLQRGIDKKRIPVVGYGETRLIRESGVENRDKSRRVVAVLEHKTMVPNYAASREGMTNLEKMRSATVADELGMDEAIKQMASKGLDVAVGTLAVLPVPGARVVAAVIIALQAGVEVTKSAASWADETFLNHHFTTIVNNYKLLQGFNESAHVNQKLLKSPLQDLRKIEHNVLQELEATEQQASDYLNAQFRLRAEAIYGLIGLLTRAANKTNDVNEYRQFLKKYKVQQYIENFVLNDQWIFPLRSLFPISLDEYWLYAINEMGFARNEPNMGFGLDKNGKWVVLEPAEYETGMKTLFKMLGIAGDMAINPLLGSIQIAKFVDNYFSNTIKAEFQKVFPVHHFSSESVNDFADVFKPTYTELKNKDIYEYTAIYWRRRGYYKDSDWQPLEQKLKSDEPELSPFDQIRVIVVLKEDVVSANSENQSIYPIRIQLSRTDGLDINGPVYKGLTRALKKGELLPDEYRFAEQGLHGAVFYPFYQFGLHTMPGVKPMASETALGALGMVATADPSEWYYRLNGLENMRYMFDVTVGRLNTKDRKNRTTRPVRVTGKDELYHRSESLVFEDARTFSAEFRVTLDIDRPHTVPEISLDPSPDPKSSKNGYDKDQMQEVRDEAVLLNKSFLVSRVKESIYPTLFVDNLLYTPSVKVMMRLGGTGKYIYPHRKFSDVLNWGANQSRFGLAFSGNNKLVVNKFDWDTPVEFIVMVSAPKIDKQAYIDKGYDWQRIAFHMDMVEYTGVDTLGPPIDVSLEYVGTIMSKKGIVSVDDSAVGEDAISKDLLPLRAILREKGEHARALCGFPRGGRAGINYSGERHFYAAHVRMKYQSLTGEVIDSIRPFGRNMANYYGILGSGHAGTRVQANGRGVGQPFRYAFTNLKSRGESGIEEDSDFKDSEFIFPEPPSYISGVPWVRTPKPDDQPDKQPIDQSDKHPILAEWLEKAEPDEKEKIKRVNQWVEEDTQSVKQPIVYTAIKP